MHLSLLALLPCVLSLGGAACCGPESWHAQAEGAREQWGKDRWLHGHREHACTEHMQWFSSSAPTLFSWALKWPSRATWGAGGWNISFEKNQHFFFKRKNDKGLCSIQRHIVIKLKGGFQSGSSLVLKVNLKPLTNTLYCMYKCIMGYLTGFLLHSSYSPFCQRLISWGQDWHVSDNCLQTSPVRSMHPDS